MSNAPWELAKSRFSHQTEDMSHFLKVQLTQILRWRVGMLACWYGFDDERVAMRV